MVVIALLELQELHTRTKNPKMEKRKNNQVLKQYDIYPPRARLMTLLSFEKSKSHVSCTSSGGSRANKPVIGFESCAFEQSQQRCCCEVRGGYVEQYRQCTR